MLRAATRVRFAAAERLPKMWRLREVPVNGGRRFVSLIDGM
ncbi:Hypotetical protein [Gulosibacter molinativorax]|nr:Hypotetical protein [Gulosibacter molinativorax]